MGKGEKKRNKEKGRGNVPPHPNKNKAPQPTLPNSVVRASLFWDAMLRVCTLFQGEPNPEVTSTLLAKIRETGKKVSDTFWSQKMYEHMVDYVRICSLSNSTVGMRVLTNMEAMEASYTGATAVDYLDENILTLIRKASYSTCGDLQLQMDMWFQKNKNKTSIPIGIYKRMLKQVIIRDVSEMSDRMKEWRDRLEDMLEYDLDILSPMDVMTYINDDTEEEEEEEETDTVSVESEPDSTQPSVTIETPEEVTTQTD